MTVSRIFCNVITNVPGLAAADYAWGGGIAAWAVAPITLSGCVISNNAIFGGAISAPGGAGAYLRESCVIRSCTVCDNRTATGQGGGILVDRAGPTKVEGCEVLRNYAGYGGGIMVRLLAAGSLTVTNCAILHNECHEYAGALYIGAGGTTTVHNTTILGNTNGYQHGSIVRIAANCNGARIQDCTIVSNTILNRDRQNKIGAALHIGAISTNNLVLNSTISHNQGGIGVRAIGGTLRNCLIAGNANGHPEQRGGGLFVEAGCPALSVSCCTIVGNSDTAGSGDVGAGLRFESTGASPGAIAIASCVIHSNGVGGADDVLDAASPANLQALAYSCVGSAPGFTGDGIRVADPRLKDPSGGNYRLSGLSPCINTGSNQDWMTGACDLDGNPRLDRSSGLVDMGAYEYLSAGTLLTIL